MLKRSCGHVGGGPPSAHLVLDLGQLVGEGDEELAVPAPLVRRQREDARQVVALLGALLLGKVAAAAQDARPVSQSQRDNAGGRCARRFTTSPSISNNQ